MTQDDIIRLAIQCRLVTTGNRDGLYMGALTEFAHLVAAKATAKEREACAKEADEYATYGGSNFYDSFKKLAAIIRARGENEEEDTKWIFEQMRGTRGAE